MGNTLFSILFSYFFFSARSFIHVIFVLFFLLHVLFIDRIESNMFFFFSNKILICF